MLDVHRNGSELELRGALDAEGGRVLLAEVTGADGDVRVDGSGLERIDGAGLTALAVARTVCRSEGRVFEVTTLPADAASGLRAARVLPVLFAASSPAPRVAARPATTTTAVDDAEPTAAPASRRGGRRRHRHRHRFAREE